MRMETLTLEVTPLLDKQALVDIYERYSPGLFRYAFRLLSDEDLAEECVAETFSRFLKAIRGGRGPQENVQAYLYRVAHNWITDTYRRQPPVDLMDVDSYADNASNPLFLVSKKQDRERVQGALMSLPPEQRQVVLLRFLEEKTHDEVASLMGKTVEATRALQYRALNTLRALLLEPQG